MGAQAPDRLQILVVDDRGHSRDLASLLQARGHAVHVADNQVAALDLAERHKVDFAMIDVGRPGIIGYEFARQLRTTARGLEITLVAVLDLGISEDRRTYYGGFDHQLERPINTSALDAVLGSPRVNKKPSTS
jgi:CheY-like chemotaxis protein